MLLYFECMMAMVYYNSNTFEVNTPWPSYTQSITAYGPISFTSDGTTMLIGLAVYTRAANSNTYTLYQTITGITCIASQISANGSVIVVGDSTITVHTAYFYYLTGGTW